MEIRMKFREMVKYRAGALCLIGILTATYLHSTTFMSQFFYQSLVLGAIAAFAIDAGVVAMSIFKDELLKDGELAWMVRVVTCLVLFASGIANMSEGFKSAYGISLTYQALTQMDWLTLLQWLAGTIIFPILAYVMCDTIGTRNLVEFRQMQREQQTRASGGSSSGRPEPARGGAIHTGNGKAKQQQYGVKEQRKRVLKKYLESNPGASMTEMASAIGVSSPATVKKYLEEIDHGGNISQNGARFSAN